MQNAHNPFGPSMLQMPPPFMQSPKCECGGNLIEKISNSAKNPGRAFLSCQNCNSFRWADDPNPIQNSKPRAVPYQKKEQNNVQLAQIQQMLEQMDSKLDYLFKLVAGVEEPKPQEPEKFFTVGEKKIALEKGPWNE